MAIVAARATPEETAAFGEWLVTAAQAAANAAKEGGFLGFGAEQVSKGETGDAGPGARGGLPGLTRAPAPSRSIPMSCDITWRS